MNRVFKFSLYAVFLGMAIGFGIAAKGSFRKAAATEQTRQRKLDEASSIENTNVVAEATNASTETTNLVAEITNATEITNEPAVVTNTVIAKKAASPASTVTAGSTTSYSKMISYSLLCVLGFAGFAVMLARDVAHFFADKAEQALFSDDGAPVDPEYEQAEELWKDAKYLEALNAMREYLNKHPREQYVALRIAEIYEQNLNNPIAAALEYEEVLKKNLPAERWGWAAIHLANIYSGKLNQSDKAVALLHRIDSEYGHTSAANKARERLMQIDPSFVPAATLEVAVGGDATTSASNLPPGFRPKT
jgi:TolA-binding protein